MSSPEKLRLGILPLYPAILQDIAKNEGFDISITGVSNTLRTTMRISFPLTFITMSALYGAVASASAAVACERLAQALEKSTTDGSIPSYLDNSTNDTLYTERAHFN